VDLAFEAARDLDEALRPDTRFGDVGVLAHEPVRATQGRVLVEDLGAVLVADRACAIDRDRTAVVLQGPELVDILQQEALHHEWCLGPWTIDSDDEHADLQFARRNRLVQSIPPQCCPPP